ncbi:hypothetical protein COW46_03480 [Candidatus Gracilibacteria bacterium CG17_big_fil_post_rev_8_21_14_2_50_48_13]|nr:MAG: hypothetical protein COW46_03480 [Candidatus Gracilibacteria bacterium CG17_big_fil_post_rev_8_21_14_2_50_48_13]
MSTRIYPTLILGDAEVAISKNQNQQDVLFVTDKLSRDIQEIVLGSAIQTEQVFQRLSQIDSADVETIRSILGEMLQKSGPASLPLTQNTSSYLGMEL